MDRARPSIRFALYAAAASGTLVSALLLLSAAAHRDEPGAIGRIIYWGLALVFYAGLAIFSGGLCRAEARRAWMAACAFISVAVAVLGGGSSAVALSGLPIAMLMWLAVRGKLW